MYFVKSSILWSIHFLLTGAEWLSTDEYLYFYSPHDQRYSYLEAISRCFGMDANLTSVLTEDEHGFLVTHMTKSNYWIGLWLEDASVECSACSRLFDPNDHVTEACLTCRKQWTWRDGSAMTGSNNELLLDKWLFSEPTGGQNCARLSTEDGRQGFWKDVGCEERYGFICKKANTLTTRTTRIQTQPLTDEPTTTVLTSQPSPPPPPEPTTTITATSSTPASSSKDGRSGVEASPSVTVALTGVLVTVVCLAVLLGVFITTCFIYSQRAKRKRYEVEKARLHLEAISRQTSNWNLSNGSATTVPQDLHVHPHDHPHVHPHVQPPVHFHNSCNEYEEPVGPANSYSTISTEPPTSFMAPPPTLPWSQSAPASKCNTPRSVRSMATSEHSMAHSSRDTPPLMCSTPGSMRNEAIAFSATVSFHNESQSVCSTPRSMRSTHEAVHPGSYPVLDVPYDNILDSTNSAARTHENTREYTRTHEDMWETSFSTFRSNHNASGSTRSTPLSIHKNPVESTTNDLHSSQERLDDIFTAFDNITKEHFEDTFDTQINPPETHHNQYSNISYENLENPPADKTIKKHNPGVFYMSAQEDQ